MSLGVLEWLAPLVVIPSSLFCLYCIILYYICLRREVWNGFYPGDLSFQVFFTTTVVGV